MSRESLVLLLGLVIVFVPYLGIPFAWKTYVLSAVGIVLMIIGFLLRRAAYLRKIDKGNGEKATDSFVESSPETSEDLEVTSREEGESVA